MDPYAKYPTPSAFMNAIKPAAVQVEQQFAIPWTFAATQAAHESRFGNSRLTREANNLFGITGDKWKALGKPIYEISTLEYDAKNTPYTVVRPFKKYDSWDASLADWATLIVHRYPVAYEAAKNNNFAEFAKGLQEGGYATDPAYATQLVQLHDELDKVA